MASMFKFKTVPDGSPFFDKSEEERQAIIHRFLNPPPRPPDPLVEAQRLAREEGVCDSIVQRYGSRETEVPKHVCRERPSAKGKCHDHYLRDHLFIEANGKLAGGGTTRRPFYKWQFPVGRLSPKQEAMLANPKRLPIGTSLEDCIARLNEIDPTNPLQANHRNPNERKFRSRRPPKAKPPTQ